MKSYLLTLILFASVFVSYSQTYPVVWTNPINVTVNGDNTLTKFVASGLFDAGAVSQNVLLTGLDGYCQFTHSGVAGNAYVVSLSRLNNDPSYTASDFSIYINTNAGSIYLYSGSSSLGSFGTPVAGDIFKIARETNTLNFYKNGVVIKSVALTANTDFFRADASIVAGSAPAVITSFRPALMVEPQFQFPGIANNNGGITLITEGQYAPTTYAWSGGETTSSITGKARGAYSVTVTDAQARSVVRTFSLGYPVAWTNQTNVTINADNSLTKTDAIGWTAGASSLNVLPPNTDGWVEFVVNDASSSYVIGLSRIDKDASYNTVNYYWQVASTGIPYIGESGANIGAFGSLMKGDVFRVAREGAFIKYYQNGVVKRSVAVLATIPFVIDLSIGNNFGPTPVVTSSFDKQIRVLATETLPSTSGNTGGIVALNIQGAYAPNPISWSSGETTNVISSKARGKYTVTVTDAATHTFSRSYQLGYPVVWTDLQNAKLNGNNTVDKTSAVGAWDASCVSSGLIAASTDGWVEFSLPNPLHTVMIGLARPNSAALYTSIDYAFYFINGDVYIDELGVSQGIVASQAEGDVYTIAREGANIKYYVNGTVVRTTPTTATYQLIVDTSIHTGSIPFMTTSFTRASQNFYAIGSGVWTNPLIWSLADGGVAGTLYPSGSDIANVKGFNVTVSSGVYCSGVNVTVTNDNTSVNVDGATALLNVSGVVTVKGSGNPNTVKGLVVQNDARLNVQ